MSFRQMEVNAEGEEPDFLRGVVGSFSYTMPEAARGTVIKRSTQTSDLVTTVAFDASKTWTGEKYLYIEI